MNLEDAAIEAVSPPFGPVEAVDRHEHGVGLDHLPLLADADVDGDGAGEQDRTRGGEGKAIARLNGKRRRACSRSRAIRLKKPIPDME